MLNDVFAQWAQIIVKEAAYDIGIVSDIMLTSKGRDKVFALAQYLFDLYVKCMTYSEAYRDQVKKGRIQSVVTAKMVKQNLSSGRKVFKFLKFVDEYNLLYQLIVGSPEGDNEKHSKAKERIVLFLSIFQKFCGMFYYLLDNLVWIANMGAINKDMINKKLKWKTVKDFFALLKTVCESSKSIIKL